MALIEDLFKGGNVVTGLALGVGAIVLGPVVVPVIGAVVRPAAKAVIKAGLYAYDRGAEVIGEIGVQTGGVIAEARGEMEQHGGAGEERSGSEHKGKRRSSRGIAEESVGPA